MSKEKFTRASFRESIQAIERVSLEEVKKQHSPVIFDTNFLFVSFEFTLDVISELQRIVAGSLDLYIIEGTINELEKIEERGDKNKKFLPLITKMLAVYNFKIIESNETYVDQELLKIEKKHLLVATNDKELRKKLKSQGKKVIGMRQKRYLEIL